MRIFVLVAGGTLRIRCLKFSLGLLVLTGGQFAGAHPLLSDRVALLTEAIDADPLNSELYLRRGDHFRLEGQTWLALADYVRSRDLDPNNRGIDYSIGALLLTSDHPDRAMPYLDRFLADEPSHPGALLTRARALAAQGAVDPARDAYARAFGRLHHPRPDHYLELARFLASHDRPAEAVAAVDEGCRRLGPSTGLHELALSVELDNDWFEAALARLDTLTRTSARRELWLTRTAELLEDLGRFASSGEAFAQARSSLEQRSDAKQQLPTLADVAIRIDNGLARLDQMASLDR